MTRSLRGWRVTVLRVSGGDDQVAAALLGLGATVRSLAVADVADVPDAELRGEVGDLSRYRWVAVTSVNAARRLGDLRSPWPRATRIAAVGPASAGAVLAAGLRCDAVAPGGTAASLASQIDAGPVLFLAGAEARDDLPGALRARGIEVATVVAYALRHRTLDAEELAYAVASDVVVAMSPGAIDAIVEAAGGVLGASLVAIGPTTAQRARERGLEVAAVAAAREPDAVAAAVESCLIGRP